MVTKLDPQKRGEIAEKVKKLLALGTDVGASPNEAATAMRMADALMRRYGLENSELILDELQQGEGIEDAFVDGMSATGKDAETIPTWASILAVAVARLFDCEVRIARKASGAAVLRFMGYASDLQIATWTYRYLLDTVRREADRLRVPFGEAARRYKNGFRNGMGTQLVQMLKAARKEKDATNEAEPIVGNARSTSTALVIAKQRAIEEKYGESKYKTTRTRSNQEAFRAGKSAASGININPNVIGSNGNGPLRLK